MTEHTAVIEWKAQESDFKGFTPDSYSRDHLITFPNGETIHGSAAVDYFGNENCVDPESLLIAALANCHMLTFLAVANKQKIRVLKYRDEAVGILDKNAEGRPAVTKVTLNPKIEFEPENTPTADALAKMHEKSHKACFIANSLKTEVEIAA